MVWPPQFELLIRVQGFERRGSCEDEGVLCLGNVILAAGLSPVGVNVHSAHWGGFVKSKSLNFKRTMGFGVAGEGANSEEGCGKDRLHES